MHHWEAISASRAEPGSKGSHRRGPGSATVCEPGARQQGAARGGLGEVAEGAAPPRRRWCRPWRPGRGQLRPRAVVSRRGGGPVRLVPYRRYSHARPRGEAGRCSACGRAVLTLWCRAPGGLMRTLRPGCALSWVVEDLADCLGEVFHRPVDLVLRHSRERYLFVVRTVLVSRENGRLWLAPAGGTRSRTV